MNRLNKAYKNKSNIVISYYLPRESNWKLQWGHFYFTAHTYEYFHRILLSHMICFCFYGYLSYNLLYKSKSIDRKLILKINQWTKRAIYILLWKSFTFIWYMSFATKRNRSFQKLQFWGNVVIYIRVVSLTATRFDTSNQLSDNNVLVAIFNKKKYCFHYYIMHYLLT